jgi:hypothetical protein
MLKTLSDNHRKFYEARLTGKRWAFVPRPDGDRFALGIAIVGNRGLRDVPTEICWSFCSDAMADYADELNEERRQINVQRLDELAALTA